MLGSIYIGLSGMQAYSKGLQIISNNVANLNTPGFKEATTQFTAMFGNTSFTGGLTYLGSGYSSAEGQGVSLGSSLLNFGQGDMQQTGNDLDLALQGSGFLTLLDGDKTFYTRTGSFAVDKDGYISQQSTGSHLGVLNAENKAVAVNVDAKRTSS